MQAENLAHSLEPPTIPPDEVITRSQRWSVVRLAKRVGCWMPSSRVGARTPCTGARWEEEETKTEYRLGQGGGIRATTGVGPATPSSSCWSRRRGPLTERRRGYQPPWAGGGGHAGRGPGVVPEVREGIVGDGRGPLCVSQGSVGRAWVAEGVGIEFLVSEAGHHIVGGRSRCGAKRL